MFICLRCKGTYFILYMQVIIEILILFNTSVKEKLKAIKDLHMSSKMITFVVGRNRIQLVDIQPRQRTVKGIKKRATYLKPHVSK